MRRLLHSVVAAARSLIRERPDSQFPQTGIGSIDSVVDAELETYNFMSPDGKRDAAVDFGRTLRIVGWFLTPAHRPFASASIVLGEKSFPCIYGKFRSDVAAIFGSEDSGRCGFAAYVPTSVLQIGRYRVIVRGETKDGETVDCDAVLWLRVQPQRQALDFFNLPLSGALTIEVTKQTPREYVDRGSHLHLEGRIAGGREPFDVAAMVDGKIIARGNSGRHSREFSIDVPVREHSDTLVGKLVAVTADERSERAIGPIFISEPPPRHLGGITELSAAAIGAVRLSHRPTEDGRVDRNYVRIEGFLFDQASGKPGRAVAARCILINGPFAVPELFWGTYGLPLGGAPGSADAPEHSRFVIDIDRRTLRTGNYRVEVLLATRDLRGFFKPVNAPSFYADDDVSLDGIIERERKLAAAS